MLGCGDGGGGDDINNVAGGTNSVSLSWDANTEPDLAGYKLYYGGASGNYTASVDVGDVTTYVFTRQAMTPYYFAVTAYNSDGRESDYSNEVIK